MTRRVIKPKEIAAVTALPGPKRYEYFVKKVADWEEAWGLERNGWALAANESVATVFPLWPGREFAVLCAKGEWAGYEPQPIEVEELLDDLLPRLKRDGIRVGVFYTPDHHCVVVEPAVLKQHLLAELEKYG